MNEAEFKSFSDFLQNTQAIAADSSSRLKAYTEFNLVFDYLQSKDCNKEDLEEKRSYSETALFQNIAEGYFRLGFVEQVFLQYSKLIYELWFDRVIEFQLHKNLRIHKGTQTHQIAIIYSMLQKNREAWDYYFAALAEDIIEGRDYINSQAYRALRSLNLSKNNLKIFAANVSDLKGKAKFNPLDIVENAKNEFIIPTYEENESIDNLKLNSAAGLWKELVKKEEKEKRKVMNNA